MSKNKFETKLFSIMVYMDLDSASNKQFYYLRLIPDWVDLEQYGFPHGLSITGARFETNEQAEAFAAKICDMLRDNENTYLTDLTDDVP